MFKLDRPGIIDIAVRGATELREHALRNPGSEWVFEYSPESFTATELDFAVEVCDAVNAVWEPTPQRKSILNLPATVEMATPNVYADQIEWFCRHVARRDSVILSVHPHNDRGTGVAAAELAVMAGADRIEGTLFGNGERTGNVDIVTLALNLYTQGIDPKLDFSNINEVARCAESVQSAADPSAPPLRRGSGVHGLLRLAPGCHQEGSRGARAGGDIWDVPYLPIDPSDLGRSYDSIIRVNSQSGKGGVAYLLERDYQLVMPRRLQIEFSQVVQAAADITGKELTSQELWDLFTREYLAAARSPSSTARISSPPPPTGRTASGCRCRWSATAGWRRWLGQGSGPIDAMVAAIGLPFDVLSYEEHSRGKGSAARRCLISRSPRGRGGRCSAPACTPTSSPPRCWPFSRRSIARLRGALCPARRRR